MGFSHTYRTLLIASLMLLLCWQEASATHNRAGEITYEQIGELTIRVTITTYTRTSSVQADRDSLTIFWGDGTSEPVARSNGNGDALENDIKRNIYISEHTYPGRATYSISMTDPNRIGGILNVNPPNSIQIRFHLETRFTFLNSQFQGFNSSAQLLQPPIDFACTGQRFIHNANAYDPDGDSLAYELIVPFAEVDSEVPNYLFPDQISPGADNILTLDAATGDLVWDAPQTRGEYNVAFKIHEYRQGVLINSIIRDMQILVEPCENQPPSIEAPIEICVVAGDQILLDVSASDPDIPTQLVSLSALGGPFQEVISPAQFSIPPNFREHPVVGTFTWDTQCEHISDQPYNVVFKAVDNFFDSTGLAELKTVRIKVVGPPPEDLEVVNVSQGNVLTWQNPYSCDMTEDQYFKGFTVWRRENSNPFSLDSCENGLDGRGYSQIGFFVMDMEDGLYTFTDPDIVEGISYCYRVTATFAQSSAAGNPFNIVESLPSNEDCAGLTLQIPFITKASVETTDFSMGAVQVEWTKPDPIDLDTMRFTGPYRYTLLRRDGFDAGNFAEVPGATFESLTFAGANDTTFLDETGLNTEGQPYTYRVDFEATGFPDGAKFRQPASTLFLTVTGSDNQNILTWEDRTPWENFEFDIYRSLDGENYDLLVTTFDRSYIDGNLINGEEYCYFIEAYGTYGFDGIVDPLVNKSQRACQVPFDAIPPCAPDLVVDNACDEENAASTTVFENTLTWRITSAGCENPEDVAGYRIYYAPNFESEFTFLVEYDDPNQQTHVHGSEFGIAGCYTVTAIDSLGNESDTSNIGCVENCPFYSLPNVFTPNADGANDLFKPYPYKFIERIDLKVFNRWGQLVFKTEDPNINWNGQNLAGRDLASGVYSYILRVFENISNANPNDPEALTGFIELIR